MGAGAWAPRKLMPKLLTRIVALLLVPCLVGAQSPEFRVQQPKSNNLSTELCALNSDPLLLAAVRRAIVKVFPCGIAFTESHTKVTCDMSSSAAYYLLHEPGF